MKYLIILSVIVLSACSSTSQITSSSGNTDVMSIIQQAAENTPKGVKGSFQLSIKATGVNRNIVYLNTELDYRDRRNITIVLHPKLVKAFISKFGTSPEIYFLNKNIEVKGKATQVKIWLTSDGRRTDKYYYQIHIKVVSIDQLTVLI
jgi:hypothetical protein